MEDGIIIGIRTLCSRTKMKATRNVRGVEWSVDLRKQHVGNPCEVQLASYLFCDLTCTHSRTVEQFLFSYVAL